MKTSQWFILLSCAPLTGATFAFEKGSSENHALKVLLFWSVDNSNRTQETVKKNIAYARAIGGRACCDVMLAHYKGTPQDWGEDWYAKEVAANLTEPGYKFKLLAKAYNRKADWAGKYEFVWVLDSDIDITNVDLVVLFNLARSTRSLIVGPTFSGDQAWQNYAGLLQEAVSSKARLLRRDGLDIRSTIHLLGMPDHRCIFRHTDFVEMTAPLLRVNVLPLLLQECTDCIHDHAEWGLDRVWCKMASESFSLMACALLDATPVAHLDWKLAEITSEFKESEALVKARYPKYWSQVQNLDCIPANESHLISVDEHGKINSVPG